MALFSAKKAIKTSQQIKDALFQIKDLDYRARPTVYQALIKELADGGVGAEELKKVIGDLRQKGEISQVDKDNLLALIEGVNQASPLRLAS